MARKTLERITDVESLKRVVFQTMTEAITSQDEQVTGAKLWKLERLVIECRKHLVNTNQLHVDENNVNDELRDMIYNKYNSMAERGEAVVCDICMEAKPATEFVVTKCAHAQCSRCAFICFTTTCGTCPICRRLVRPTLGMVSTIGHPPQLAK